MQFMYWLSSRRPKILSTSTRGLKLLPRANSRIQPMYCGNDAAPNKWINLTSYSGLFWNGYTFSLQKSPL